MRVNAKCKVVADVCRFHRCLYIVSNYYIAAERVMFKLKYGDGILLMASISRFTEELCQKHFFLITHSDVAYFRRWCRCVPSTLWPISVALVQI